MVSSYWGNSRREREKKRENKTVKELQQRRSLEKGQGVR